MDNWAPYQSAPPEEERSRSLSPVPRGRTISPPPLLNKVINPWANSRGNNTGGGLLPGPGGSGGSGGVGSSSSAHLSQDSSTGFGGVSRDYVNQFETSLPIRMDWEAVLCYVLLPPAGAVFILLIEHKSDYVRFHAWQSALLFVAMFIVHLIFSFSSVMSWMLFTIDLILILFLSSRAYRDGIFHPR